MAVLTVMGVLPRLIMVVFWVFYLHHISILYSKACASESKQVRNSGYLGDSGGWYSLRCDSGGITNHTVIVDGGNVFALDHEEQHRCIIDFVASERGSGYWQIRLNYGMVLGRDYLVVKTGVNTGSGQYEVLENKLLQPCHASFALINLTVYTYGNIGFKMREILNMEMMTEQEVTGQTSTTGNIIGNCHDSIEYDDLIMCQNVDLHKSLKCNIRCSSNCLCILGDRSITSLCPEDSLSQGSQFQEKITTFVAFPNPVIKFRLPGRNLTSLSTDAFTNIGANMTELGLWKNRLSHLSLGAFNGLDHLQHLELDQNNLAELEMGIFRGLANLRRLYLFENQLVNLHPGIFEDLESLTNLSLGYNRLTVLEDGVFKGLGKLTTLYVESNELVSIGDTVFQHCAKLERLSLANNQLTYLTSDLFHDLTLMASLNMSYNNIYSIPNIQHMKTLKVLSMRGNPLTTVTKIRIHDSANSVVLFVDQPEICECALILPLVNCSATIPMSQYLTCKKLLPSNIFAVLIWIILLGALFGNMLVLFWRNSHGGDDHLVQTILICNLAMSDFLMGVYLICIATADVYYGEYFPMNANSWRHSTWCGIAGATVITSSEASVLFLTLISIDRLIRIKFPHSTRKLTVSRAKIAATVVWLIAVVLGILPSIMHNDYPAFYETSNMCVGLPLVQQPVVAPKEVSYKSTYHWITNPRTINITVTETHIPGMFFSSAIFLGLNPLCFLIMLACYADIVRIVRKAFRQSRHHGMRQQLRTTVKVAAIVATDFCCWFPIIITGILVQTGSVSVTPTAYAWIVTLVMPINSALNPYLYTLATILSNQRAKKPTDRISMSLDQTCSPVNAQNGIHAKRESTEPAGTSHWQYVTSL